MLFGKSKSGKRQSVAKSLKMRNQFFLLLTFLAAIAARNILPTSPQADKYIPIIKQLVEHQDIVKLCVIRLELKQEVKSYRLVKFLDDTAASKIGFSPSDCTEEPDIEALEVSEENSPKTDTIGENGNALELEAFVEGNAEQDSAIDQASVQAILHPNDGSDPLKPLADLLDGLESSRVKAENDKRGSDIDLDGLDNSAGSTATFTCSNCSSDGNRPITEFTSTLEEDQSSSEMFKLIGTIIGFICLAVVVLAGIVCLCLSCTRTRKRSTNPRRDNGQPRRQTQFSH